MREHACDREPHVGSLPGVVVVAAGEVLVGHDRGARHGGEGDVLRGEAGRAADLDPGSELVGMVDRPLQDLHRPERAADRACEPLDTEVREQPAVHLHQIGDGEDRKAEPVGPPRRRVGRRWAGRAAAAPEQVGRDDMPPVRVERPTGADQVVPPADPGGIAMVAGRMGVAGEGVAHENRVRSVEVQLTVGLIGDLGVRELRARVEHERVVAREEDDPSRVDQTDRAGSTSSATRLRLQRGRPPWRAPGSGHRGCRRDARSRPRAAPCPA